MSVARSFLSLLVFALLLGSLRADDGIIMPAEPMGDVPTVEIDGEFPEEFLYDEDELAEMEAEVADDLHDFWKKRRKLADKHAPAHLMGDHVHHQGKSMVEYKYMLMSMDENRIGKTTISDPTATFGLFGTNNAATPTSMTMEMHMLHYMYGWTDDITLYTMLNYQVNRMDHLRSPTFPDVPLQNVPFTTQYSGLGDIGLGALVRIYHTECEDLILNLGCSIPSGVLDRQTNVPRPGFPQEYPYPMRPSDGTFNARPGITYKRYLCRSSYGAQFQTDLPLGRNDEGYSVSDEFRLNFWYSHLVHDRFALSFRVENLWESNYDGADPDLVQPLISTNRPDMRGGHWVNFGYGASVLTCNGHLFNVEVTQPVYQYLDGIQLETDWTLAASWSKGF